MTNRKRNIIGVLATILFAVLGWAIFEQYGREPTDRDASSSQPVRIGAVLPLTGPAAALGEVFRQGLDLGVQHVNAKNTGRSPRLQLSVEDGRGDPTASLSAFRKLRLDGVEIIITTTSGVCLALAPVAIREGILLFADAMHPAITGSSELVFRHNFTAQQEAELLAAHVSEKLNPKRVSLLWINDEFGTTWQQSFRSALEKRAVDIAQFVSFERTETDFRNVGLKALDSSPDVVTVVGFGRALGMGIRRLRQLGFTGPIVANAGVVFTPDAVTAAGESIDGVYYTDYALDRENNEYKSLVTEYRQQFGNDPTDQVAIQFNEILLLASAISKAGGGPKAIAATLRDLRTFTGAGESMVIQGNGYILPKLQVRRFARRQ